MEAPRCPCRGDGFIITQESSKITISGSGEQRASPGGANFSLVTHVTVLFKNHMHLKWMFNLKERTVL